jgi:hypothetical protein
MAGPPRLSALVWEFRDVAVYQDFVHLVREYLPDLEQDILQAGRPAEMVAAFAIPFRERYFPLHSSIEAGMAEGFYDLLNYIPIEVYGWAEDDYHSIPELRPGIILGSLLVDFEGHLGWVGEGVRITIVEAAAQLVPVELVQRAVAYPLNVLRVVLRGSRYAGLLTLAETLCHDTGNPFLDATYEDLWSDPPEWDRRTVENLTADWQTADAALKRMWKLLEWLEASPGPNFTKVLDFLGRRTSYGKPKVGTARRHAAAAR